jgi:hypothetical protein
VRIKDVGTVGTKIYSNRIGTNVAGSAALANLFSGVIIENNASGTRVGTQLGFDANTIRFNGGAGVAIVSGLANTVLSNSISDNGGLGIDLGNNGVTLNDVGDADGGPNNLQNFPILSNVVYAAGSVSMRIALNSTPSQTFTAKVFRSFGCDASGYGEGQFELGTFGMNTDAGGNAVINGAMMSLGTSSTEVSYASATAISVVNDSSEFGPCVAISDLIFKNGFETALPRPLADTPLFAEETAEPSIESVAVPGLRVDGQGQVLPNGQVLLTLLVGNSGTQAIAAPVIGVTASNAVVVLETRSSAGRCILAGRVECRIDELKAGASTLLEVLLSPADGNSFNVRAQVEIDGKLAQQRLFPIIRAPTPR